MPKIIAKRNRHGCQAGGDEFACLLPETEQEAAKIAAGIENIEKEQKVTSALSSSK